MKKEKMFRLKRDACKYFDEDFAIRISPICDWDFWTINRNAIEEIEGAYISFGIKKEPHSVSRSLSGWNDENGSVFHFTINVPFFTMKEHEDINNEMKIRAIMDKINAIIQTELWTSKKQ